MSNMAALPQLVEPVPANPGIGAAAGDLLNVNEVENFAIQFNKEHQGNWVNVDSLGGFCLLLKREVLNKIGPALDEWSDLSLFDTDIFSAKARQAGYSLAVCRDLFVHHFGTRMFVHGPPKTNPALF